MVLIYWSRVPATGHPPDGGKSHAAQQHCSLLHRQSFDNDSAYWSYAHNRLFKRIGAQSFVFQADPSGTLLGGSHVFMDARDWARLGQLFLQVQVSCCEDTPVT